MSAYHAKQQFEDNLRHFADSPEKRNLYNGLGNIAMELQAIRSELQTLRQEVARLKK